MSWSLGEISALSVKATRGAGRSWGEAEEVGWAVRWLCRSGIDGAGALARLLCTPDGGACPVRTGLGISDSRGDWPGPETMIREPVLVLPFLARDVAEGQGAEIDLAGTRVSLSRSGAYLAGDPPARAGIRRLGSGPAPAPRTRPRSDTPTDDTLGALSLLAGRTYAPATEQSRISGAGAGLSDND